MSRESRQWIALMLRLLLPILVLSGCTTWQNTIEQSGLTNKLVTGTAFRHRVLVNPAGEQARLQPSPVLWHVYLEGDGQAVTARGRESNDPTSRSPLLLPVMAQDPQPAIYLGRPCYFDTGDPACNPSRWTRERYSEATVASLAAALKGQIRPEDSLMLIGHSGGGTLAVLLAPRLPQIRGLVTVAGNLDLARWISTNRYTPLPDCLDPMEQPPLPPAIRQWHLAGGEDEVIKAEWIQGFVTHQTGAEVIILEQADHHSPWADWLPDWLSKLDLAPGPAR